MIFIGLTKTITNLIRLFIIIIRLITNNYNNQQPLQKTKEKFIACSNLILKLPYPY